MPLFALVLCTLCAGVVSGIGNCQYEPSYYGHVTIPNSDRSIPENAFYQCTSLWSVIIPDSVTSIGDGAFYGCTRLTSVTIPDSVTSIGDEAFRQCIYLTSVTIGNSVTSIGREAFSGGMSLTSITIPDSVTSIGNYAFSGTYIPCLPVPHLDYEDVYPSEDYYYGLQLCRTMYKNVVKGFLRTTIIAAAVSAFVRSKSVPPAPSPPRSHPAAAAPFA